jgi:hypothetical protein
VRLSRRGRRRRRGRSSWWFAISPAAAVLWSSTLAVVALLFPPGYYEQLIWEPNYVHHSLPVLLYVALCVAAFAVGYGFHKGLAAFISSRRSPGEEAWRKQPVLIPLVIGVCVVLIPVSVYVLASLLSTVSISMVTGSLLGEESSSVLRRGAAEAFAERNIGYVFGATVAVVPWLVWKALSIRASRRRASLEGYAAVALVSVLLLVITASAVLVQSRSHLLYLVFAAFVAWVAFRLRQGRMRPGKLLLVGSGVFIFAQGYFALIAVTRALGEASGVSYAAEKLVGYTVGSYNRFAAMLDGALTIPGGGGYYWTQWLWRLPAVRDLFDLDSAAAGVFGTIPPVGFAERMSYIYNAGLNESLTAFTIFAHSYVDFGWLGFIPFIAYGFLGSLAWAAFRDGRPWALVLYPQVLWSIFDWRGYLDIARSLAVIVFVAVAVGLADLLARRYAASVGPAARASRGGATYSARVPRTSRSRR